MPRNSARGSARDPGTRSTKGSCGLGRCRCTASITCCVAWGPVTASTLGCMSRTRLPLPSVALPALRTEAAGDDDTAVRGQRLADGVQAFLHRVVDEAAGVDDDQVGARERLAGVVALGAQLGQDQFGIGQRLRAAERNKADGGHGRRSGQAGGGRRREDVVHRSIFSDVRRRRAGSALLFACAAGVQRFGVNPGIPGNSVLAFCICISNKARLCST